MKFKIRHIIIEKVVMVPDRQMHKNFAEKSFSIALTSPHDIVPRIKKNDFSRNFVEIIIPDGQ